jgi:hypothetical protein
LTDKGGVTGYNILVEVALSILNTILRPLLESVLNETISLDYYQDPPTSPSKLGLIDNAGTYVVAIYIRGREGKFLTRLEIEKLV